MCKKFFSILLLFLCLFYFPEKCEASKKDLIVFAAASMTETMNQIKILYENEHNDINIIYNFDSSGTLKTQIQEGAECDLFISAGQKQMDQLSSEIFEGSRINFLENKTVLVVPEGNPKNIKSFADLVNALKNKNILFAMGNSDVPVGQYTQKIFEYYGLNENKLASEGKITYGTNVKEVTTQIKESAADCGVVYCTDAFSAGLTVVDIATPEMCGRVIYPAAIIKNSKNIEEAKEFLNYLISDSAIKIFKTYGFLPAL